jgi:hypothetical protein
LGDTVLQAGDELVFDVDPVAQDVFFGPLNVGKLCLHPCEHFLGFLADGLEMGHWSIQLVMVAMMKPIRNTAAAMM